MAPQKFYNFFQKGTHVEKIEGTTFSNINTKNMFYGILTHAESESGVRKILKKSLKKVMGQKLFGTQTLPAHTSQDSSGSPTCYIFFCHSGDALQDRLFKSGFALDLKNSTIWVLLPDLYSSTLVPNSSVQLFFISNTLPFKWLFYTPYLSARFSYLLSNFPLWHAVSVPHSTLAPKRSNV